MTKFLRHTTEEMNNWEHTQAKELAKIHASQHHLIYNLLAYVLISIIEYWLAELSKSQTLRADAFNNLSGIISTFLLMMGLHIAQDVDDDDIIGARLPTGNYQAHMGSDQRVQFVRWRYETIFSLVTAVVMIAIALSVIIDGIKVAKPSKPSSSTTNSISRGRDCIDYYAHHLVYESTNWPKAKECCITCFSPRQSK